MCTPAATTGPAVTTAVARATHAATEEQRNNARKTHKTKETTKGEEARREVVMGRRCETTCKPEEAPKATQKVRRWLRGPTAPALVVVCMAAGVSPGGEGGWALLVRI